MYVKTTTKRDINTSLAKEINKKLQMYKFFVDIHKNLITNSLTRKKPKNILFTFRVKTRLFGPKGKKRIKPTPPTPIEVIIERVEIVN